VEPTRRVAAPMSMNRCDDTIIVSAVEEKKTPYGPQTKQ
jgi:hypothetical protein